MAKKKTGTLIIIGGGEDKHDGAEILKVVAERANSGKLVIATVASRSPQEYAKQYREVFAKLGVKEIEVLDVRERQDAFQEDRAALVEDAEIVFFTGGDQLRITSQVGDSAVYQGIHAVYQRGGTIAGTSAGASVMSTTMMVSGAQAETQKVGEMHMAPGFGLIENVIIDQHFAERGRISRLITAVAKNPSQLGVGIDEDTAIVVHDGSFDVVGSGCVYVVDGARISASNISEGNDDDVLSCFDVRLHVLNSSNCFNLVTRRPGVIGRGQVESLEEGKTAG